MTARGDLSRRKVPKNADAKVWRCTCGSWRYGALPCSTCAALRKLAGRA